MCNYPGISCTILRFAQPSVQSTDKGTVLGLSDMPNLWVLLKAVCKAWNKADCPEVDQEKESKILIENCADVDRIIIV